MQTKTHLSRSERDFIAFRLRLHDGIREIGRRLGRDHSVISREVRRNLGGRKRYDAAKASDIEAKRRARRKGRKLEKDAVLHDFVLLELRRGMTPDVIAGCIRCEPPRALGGRSISHESIYQYIYAGEGRHEGLYHLLAHHRPRRQKRGTRKARQKSRIPGRIPISARPEYVNDRSSFGHWESDTVIYAKQRAVLSVQIERVSRLLRFHRAPSKSAEDTEHAIRKTVESMPTGSVRTMTFDNGTEGARHGIIRDEYGISTYFCDAYASWQKGAVENANRIIRKHLPRHKDLSVLSDREIHDIQETINDTPRKCLGYRTPNFVAAQYEREGGALLG
jgi:IS30 family transposase